LTKVCGITRLEDALAAAEAGAEAVGFMFYPPSKRAVTPEAARQIIRQLPPRLRKVGVFVDALPDTVRLTVEVSGIDTLQFHGEESPEYCHHFAPLPIWKAFRIRSRESLARLTPYAEVAAWLLDSFVADQPGGTGATFNWELAVEAGGRGRPIILAGGLTPRNVAAAVQQVRPWGVDVSSGVEASPGRKDPSLIRNFITAVRQATA